MKNKLRIKILFSLFYFFLVITPLFGQTESDDSQIGSLVKVMFAILAFMVAGILWLVFAFSEKEEDIAVTKPLKGFWNLVNKTRPLEEENKILLDHDYDGIRELDNKIPPWFNAILIGTVVWAVIYMINYHIVGSGNVMEEEFNEEMKLASIQQEILAASGGLIDENIVTVVSDDLKLMDGKDIYIKNCAACHGMNGEGLVGPNFTDDYWIHGGDIKDLFRVIKYGVPAKGMITWEPLLSPQQMQNVASYILTMRGTNPPNQKAPEGEIYEYSKDQDPNDSDNIDNVKL